MKAILFTNIICLLAFSSCMISKESRAIKKQTKDWRSSEVILSGYSDSPLGSSFLTLRQNGKFEMTSSGFMMKWLGAGMWTKHNDTIELSYVDPELKVIYTEKIFFNPEKTFLLFIKDGDTINRMRVMANPI